MGVRLILRIDGAANARVLNVVAAPETPLGIVAARLLETVGAPAATPMFTAAGPLDLGVTLGESPLRDGMVLSVGTPLPLAPPTPGPRLVVISGPDSGSFVPLRPGVTAIGRDPGCQLQLHDPEVSRRHAVITLDAEGVWLTDTGSANGTFLGGGELDGTRLGEQPIQLPPHTIVRCGGSVFWLTKTGRGPELAAQSPPQLIPLLPLPTYPTPEGTLELLRPPRIIAPTVPPTITYPNAPQQLAAPSTPWLGVILSVCLPLALSGVLWWFMGEEMGVAGVSMLGFMALTPVLMLTQVLTDRWGRRRAARTASAAHQAALVATDRLLAIAQQEEVFRRCGQTPDAPALADIAQTPSLRLWERRPNNPDWLRLRIGLATLPAELVVHRGSITTSTLASSEHPALPLVPATIELGTAGVLGIAGSGSQQLCQWLLAQLATLHSPGELRLALLSDADRNLWQPASWFPHIYGDHAPDGYGIATNAASQQALVSCLATLIRRRAARCHDRPNPAQLLEQLDEPAVVLLCDSTHRLVGLPGGRSVLDDGPTQRVYTIYRSADARALPGQCRASITLPSRLQLHTGSALRATLAVTDAPQITGILPELVSVAWSDQLSRALAPLRERTSATQTHALPASASFSNLLSATFDHPSDCDCNYACGHDDPSHWSQARLAEQIAARWRQQPACTEAVIGFDGHGPVSIDLAADGPHALIAGTTGAGKSELLRTWIASLALHNRPDELNLLLIDYKGGAAFAECAELPHVVGLVTDLDAALTSRVLSSLHAELQRRERQLAAVGASDFSELGELAPDAGLARLIVVIDEFAALTTELPELVTGLVDLARRGRSLGVHLVLATQRPAGVVSAEIRANTALRICLRVTDAQDSTDVIDTADAARIDPGVAGRAIMRRQGQLAPMQVAHVSHPWLPPLAKPRDAQSVDIHTFSWHSPPPGAAPPISGASTHSGTAARRAISALHYLVQTIRLAASRAQLRHSAPPWLPPLAERLTLTELKSIENLCPADGAAVGLHDIPHEQRQRPFSIQLVTAGHMLLAGGPRSGRSSALRTIAASLVDQHSPEQLRIFAFDNSGELATLEALPHCDGVVAPDDAEHCQRVLRRLRIELQRRRVHRAPATRDTREGSAPWLVLLLDSWETFRHSYDDLRHGALLSELSSVLRDGGGLGLRAFVSGDRSLLASSIVTLLGTRLILPMADADSYGLAGIARRDVPQQFIPGRAILPNTPVTTMQFAQLDPDPAPSAQRAALNRLGTQLRRRWPQTTTGAMPVRALPRLVTPDMLKPATRQWCLPIGLGGDNTETLELDLSETTTALIAGPPASGKTSTLLAMAAAAADQGARLIIATPGRSALSSALPTASTAADAQQLTSLLNTDSGPRMILVDDVELLADSDVDAALSAIISLGHHRVVLAGGTDELLGMFRGCTVAARRTRTGVLLAARAGDGELLGQPRLAAGGVLDGAGRGLLIQHGTVTALQMLQSQEV